MNNFLTESWMLTKMIKFINTELESESESDIELELKFCFSWLLADSCLLALNESKLNSHSADFKQVKKISTLNKPKP